MTNQWLRSFVLIAFAGLVLAGCASRGSKAEPAEGVGPYDGQETTRGPSTTDGARFGFDAQGNPFVPGTNEPLARVFYFEFDSSQLQQSDLRALEMHAMILRENPDRAIVVEGHADERGTREYNLALGERRANAIRSFLTAAGVSSRQVESVSYGEERPDDPGTGEAAWARNRRAVLVYR
ncbi:MAG: peptidoglycan-associated lipoprotein Pal [Pseudomonadales bacterium]|nr:peptidoglycan-associated lipoprotein Pal [Pseudomonadales bacterium]